MLKTLGQQSLSTHIFCLPISYGLGPLCIWGSETPTQWNLFQTWWVLTMLSHQTDKSISLRVQACKSIICSRRYFTVAQQCLPIDWSKVMCPLGVLSVFLPHKNLLWILLTHKTDGFHQYGGPNAKGPNFKYFHSEGKKYLSSKIGQE